MKSNQILTALIICVMLNAVAILCQNREIRQLKARIERLEHPWGNEKTP